MKTMDGAEVHNDHFQTDDINRQPDKISNRPLTELSKDDLVLLCQNLESNARYRDQQAEELNKYFDDLMNLYYENVEVLAKKSQELQECKEQLKRSLEYIHHFDQNFVATPPTDEREQDGVSLMSGPDTQLVRLLSNSPDSEDEATPPGYSTDQYPDSDNSPTIDTARYCSGIGDRDVNVNDNCDDHTHMPSQSSEKTYVYPTLSTHSHDVKEEMLSTAEVTTLGERKEQAGSNGQTSEGIAPKTETQATAHKEDIASKIKEETNDSTVHYEADLVTNVTTPNVEVPAVEGRPGSLHDNMSTLKETAEQPITEELQEPYSLIVHENSSSQLPCECEAKETPPTPDVSDLNEGESPSLSLADLTVDSVPMDMETTDGRGSVTYRKDFPETSPIAKISQAKLSRSMSMDSLGTISPPNELAFSERSQTTCGEYPVKQLSSTLPLATTQSTARSRRHAQQIANSCSDLASKTHPVLHRRPYKRPLSQASGNHTETSRPLQVEVHRKSQATDQGNIQLHKVSLDDSCGSPKTEESEYSPSKVVEEQKCKTSILSPRRSKAEAKIPPVRHEILPDMRPIAPRHPQAHCVLGGRSDVENMRNTQRLRSISRYNSRSIAVSSESNDSRSSVPNIAKSLDMKDRRLPPKASMRKANSRPAMGDDGSAHGLRCPVRSFMSPSFSPRAERTRASRTRLLQEDSGETDINTASQAAS